MVSIVVFNLYNMAMDNEDFTSSSFYEPPEMFEYHDCVFYRIAKSYVTWLIQKYQEQWVDNIGNMVYGEYDGEMTIYLPQETTI